MLKILLDNKGVHEPQEELTFQEVLKNIPKNATMIELGSYRSFYSMWFQQKIENASNHMIEPSPERLEIGKLNFQLNRFKGTFYRSFVGAVSQTNNDGSKVISIDDYIKKNKIDFVHILHSDIQGAELEMLKGCQNSIKQNKIGYVFISTHSNELHNDCTAFLLKHDFTIVASAILNESYSHDGVLVMKAPNFGKVEKVKISKKGVRELP
jgi:hypothetical protein